jgi:hypothetical protein
MKVVGDDGAIAGGLAICVEDLHSAERERSVWLFRALSMCTTDAGTRVRLAYCENSPGQSERISKHKKTKEEWFRWCWRGCRELAISSVRSCQARCRYALDSRWHGRTL